MRRLPAPPDAIAIIDLCGDAERVTRYGDLERRLDAVASWCAAAGLRAGDRLAMAVGNRTEFVEIMFGAMRAGVVPVPLNTRLGPTVLEHILRDADCRAALVEPSASRHIIAVAELLGVEVRVALDAPPPGWKAYEAEISGFLGRSFSPPDLDPDHPSFQPYTSGIDRDAEGGDPHSRRPDVVDPRSPEILADVAPDPGARRGASLPQERHGGRRQADAPHWRLGRPAARLSSRGAFSRPWRDTDALGQARLPTVFTQLLQQHDLIERLDFSALETLSIRLGAGSGGTADGCQEDVRVPRLGELRIDRRRAGDDRSTGGRAAESRREAAASPGRRER